MKEFLKQALLWTGRILWTPLGLVHMAGHVLASRALGVPIRVVPVIWGFRETWQAESKITNAIIACAGFFVQILFMLLLLPLLWWNLRAGILALAYWTLFLALDWATYWYRYWGTEDGDLDDLVSVTEQKQEAGRLFFYVFWRWFEWLTAGVAKNR